MPYTETHRIDIDPITLPDGVTISVLVVPGSGGQQSLAISAETSTSKEDTASLLEKAFAVVAAAASFEGVGQPLPALQAPGSDPAPAPALAPTP